MVRKTGAVDRRCASAGIEGAVTTRPGKEPGSQDEAVPPPPGVLDKECGFA